MRIGQAYRLKEWLKQQAFVCRLRQNFPALFTFFINRFDVTHFTGLPLTLVLVVFCCNLLLLSELTESVVESEGIVKLDESFTQLLYQARTELISRFFYFVSYFGTREAVFGIGGIVTILLFIRKEYVAIVAFWVVMAGTGLSVQYGKKYISRDRPEEVGYYTEINFSFPSGHATTSMALFGFTAYLLHRLFRTGRVRVFIMVIASLFILFVGFSRIYLGVHYLSDVLAGFLLGLLWVLLGLSVLEWLHYLQHHRKS